MTRPALQEVPLASAFPLRAGELTVTMAQGQWDEFLAASYAAGAVLLELDDNERPIAAYQRAAGGVQ